MALGNEIIIGTSINNTMGITGQGYDLRQLVNASREAEAMGFDAVWVHDALGGQRSSAARQSMGADETGTGPPTHARVAAITIGAKIQTRMSRSYPSPGRVGSGT